MHIFMITSVWKSPEVDGNKIECVKKRRVKDGIKGGVGMSKTQEWMNSREAF